MEYKGSKEESFGVIGLGRFGSALVISLAEAGKEVLAIDCDEEKVASIRDYTEYALVVDNLNKETLEETGVQNCDVVIVCIGEKIDSSILTTLHVVSLGVPKVIAKAISYDQGCILKKIGADVVYPERDMAVRLAKQLTSRHMLNYLELNKDVEITEIRATERIAGKSVVQMDLRKKFGLNIIAIQKGTSLITDIAPERVVEDGDYIVVIGSKEGINRFLNWNQ